MTGPDWGLLREEEYSPVLSEGYQGLTRNFPVRLLCIVGLTCHGSICYDARSAETDNF